jgi:hypothetical protein
MFFIVEITDLKNGIKSQDINFSSNEYKVRVLDMDENEYFSSNKVVEESKNKDEIQEVKEETNENVS